MAYIRKHARFTILDDVPADVWQESSPAGYLCIVDEEPADYHGNFTACTFTAALYQGEHVPVSADYLKKCTHAPEDIARKILAFYLRNWAAIEDDDTAALLLDSAEEISKQA